MSVDRVVHSHPEIMHGTPVFLGTRVPVKNLIDYLEAGDSLDDFLRSFPTVTREQAVAALDLAGEEQVAHSSNAQRPSVSRFSLQPIRTSNSSRTFRGMP